MRNRDSLVLVLILLTSFAYTQSVEESVAEISTVEQEEIEEEWEHYLKHPVDINTATAIELQVFRLSQIQVDNFLSYRKSTGKFIDVHELQAIPGWDAALIRRLMPYVGIGREKIEHSMRNALKKGNGLYLLRWSLPAERSRAYRDDHFAGTRSKLLFKYRFKYKSILQYGITLEKDPGEKVITKGLPDFVSAHVVIRDQGIMKTLVAGDFSVSLGQGLTEWGGRSNLGADVIRTGLYAEILQPYSSINESGYHRGAGVTLKKNKLEGIFFGSVVKQSSSQRSDTILNNIYISSNSTSGLHRTITEIHNRNNVRLLSGGFNLSFIHKSLRVGVNAIGYSFSVPMRKEEILERPEIDRMFNAGFNYSYTYRNFYCFGEVAVDRNLNPAMLGGVFFSADARIDVSILYRRIHWDYHAYRPNAFTSASAVQNESGFYAGIALRPSTRWQFNFYADMALHPFSKYRVNGISRSSEAFVHVTYQPNKRVQIYSRFRKSIKSENNDMETIGLKPLSEVFRKSWRIHYIYVWSSNFTLQARSESVWWEKDDQRETGFLWYLEPAFLLRKTYKLKFRLSAFETASFETRIYSYESDVLYSSQLPFFYEKGYRYYIICRRSVGKGLDVSLKWARSVYPGKRSIGEGWDETPGNRRSELRLQLLYMIE